MKKKERDAACSKTVKRDILLIDDAMPLRSRKITIEERDGTTIIRLHSMEAAIDVLRTVTVDVIYNYRALCGRQEAQGFNDYVAKRYPNVRVVDLWTHSNGGTENHLLPLYLRGGFDCDTRRSMWLNEGSSDASRPPKRPCDQEGVGIRKSQSTPPDDRAA